MKSFLLTLFLLLGLSLPALAQSFSGQSAGDVRVVSPYKFCVGPDNGTDVCLSQSGSGQMKFSGGVTFQDLIAKNTPYVDPRAYGAKGDCVTDDTAAVQAAINAAVGSVGASATQTATLYIPQPSGTNCYLISAPIYYFGANGYGIHITGSLGGTRATSGGSGARFKWSATAPANLPMFVAMGANASVFEHLEFDLNNRARVGIHLNPPYGVTTLGTSVTAGSSQTVTPGSMGGLAVGSLEPIDSGSNFEFVYITATTGTTFTAFFTKAHAATASIGSGQSSSGVILQNISVVNVPSAASVYAASPGVGSAAIVIGGPANGGTPQVSEVRIREYNISGANTSGTTGATGIIGLPGGSVKNHWIDGGTIAYMERGIDEGTCSGTVRIVRAVMSNTVTADFVAGTCNVVISEAEVESGLATGHQFLIGSQSSGNGVTILRNNSFQAAAPANDYIISTGMNLVMEGNNWFNTRTASSVPKIQVGAPLWQASNQPSWIISIGNFYQNAAAGYPPLYDTSNNVLLPNYYNNQPVDVLSIGDVAWPSAGGSVTHLKSYIPSAFFASQVPQFISSTGVLNCGTTDTCVAFRNNANSGDVNGVSKNASDVVNLGGSAGVSFNLLQFLASSTVASLPTCNAGAQDQMRIVTDANAPTYNATVAGGGAVRIPVYCNGANWVAH